MNGPPRKPDQPDARAGSNPLSGDVSGPATGLTGLVALAGRQNRMIDELSRENAILRLKVESLIWALANLRKGGLHFEGTTTPSTAAASIEEGVEGVMEGVPGSGPVPPAALGPLGAPEVEEEVTRVAAGSAVGGFESKFETSEKNPGWGLKRTTVGSSSSSSGRVRRSGRPVRRCLACNREFHPNRSQVACKQPGCPTYGMTVSQQGYYLRKLKGTDK